MILWIANVVSRMTPATRGFRLRAALFRLGGVTIDRTARICGRVTFDNPHAVIGRMVWIGGGSRIIGGPDATVVISDNCDLGPEVLLVTGTHDIGNSCRRAGAGRSRSIHLGPGVWIGARATVLSGVSIGSGAMIAAGSVVTNMVESNVLAAGVPAIPKRLLP